ncbi:MAG TPA: helix-turn-helix domain-containing protein [Aldersonia sp.]
MPTERAEPAPAPSGTAPPTDFEVAELLRDAAGMLLGRTSPIAERALVRLREEVSYYGSGALAPTDVAESVHRGIEAGVRSFADPAHRRDSGIFAWETGRRRAAEDAPLLPLVQAYRAGVAELWDAMIAAVAAQQPHRLPLMAHCANQYWRQIDRDLTLMVESYRVVANASGSEDARRFLPVLRVLLRGHVDPVDLSSAAIGLDVPARGRFVVACVRKEVVRGELDTRQEVDGIVIYNCPKRQGGTTVIAYLGERSPADVADVLAATHPGVGIGISAVVEGLSELARAREWADLALRAATDDAEIVTLPERLGTALLLARPDLAALCAATVLGPVLELEASDRTALLDTLQAWLDCRGSAAQAGKRLYCHPNTVLNRLRRLERLTDRYLDAPRDLADLVSALDACRLVRPD